MPKKFTLTDKSEWLDLYNQGKSEKQIAKQYVCDVRTVQRGLDEARRAQDARAAQREIIKDALKKHQGDLIRVVNELIYVMVPPQPETYIEWHRQDTPQAISLSKTIANYEGGGKWTVIPSVENDPAWDLFREHSKRSKLMKELALWKRAIVDHIKTRVELQQRLGISLEKETGLTIESPGIQGIESIATHELYRIAIRKILGYSEGQYSEKDIKTGKPGEVMLTGHRLARVGEGKEVQCKNSIMIVLVKLLESQEAQAVISTNETLKQVTGRVKGTLQEMSMLGLVPGRCRICQQLGL